MNRCHANLKCGSIADINLNPLIDIQLLAAGLANNILVIQAQRYNVCCKFLWSVFSRLCIRCCAKCGTKCCTKCGTKCGTKSGTKCGTKCSMQNAVHRHCAVKSFHLSQLSIRCTVSLKKFKVVKCCIWVHYLILNKKTHTWGKGKMLYHMLNIFGIARQSIAKFYFFRMQYCFGTNNLSFSNDH